MAALIAAFVSGWFAGWFLGSYLKTRSLQPFVVYRLLLAAGIFILVLRACRHRSPAPIAPHAAGVPGTVDSRLRPRDRRLLQREPRPTRQAGDRRGPARPPRR